MISPNIPDSDKPGSLPLLTELADQGTLDELPTLTEIVATHAAATAPTHDPDDDLPILLEKAETDTSAPHPPDQPDLPAPLALSETQLLQLEQRLAAHLEIVLRDKLGTRLEQLQKSALNLTLAELKAELPELLRDALPDHLKPR